MKILKSADLSISFEETLFRPKLPTRLIALSIHDYGNIFIKKIVIHSKGTQKI